MKKLSTLAVFAIVTASTPINAYTTPISTARSRTAAEQDELSIKLGFAVQTGQFDQVQQLIKQGASVGPQKNGISPLFIATATHRPEIVEYLIAQGADLNAVDPIFHMTAFQKAVQEDDLATAKILANSGADTHLKPDTQNTQRFAHFANMHSPEMRQFLEELHTKK